MHEIIQCPKCQGYSAVGSQNLLKIVEDIPVSLADWLFKWFISVIVCLILEVILFAIWFTTRKDMLLIGLTLTTLTFVFLLILAYYAIPVIRHNSLYIRKRIVIGYNWQFRCRICQYDWVWPDNVALPATVTRRLTSKHPDSREATEQ